MTLVGTDDWDYDVYSSKFLFFNSMSLVILAEGQISPHQERVLKSSWSEAFKFVINRLKFANG